MNMLLNRSRNCLYWKRLFHVFKNEYVPSSKLAEELKQSVIYHENGILVLNKPYGISFSQDAKSQKQDRLEVSLKTMMPHLQDLFECSNIYNVRVPEKYVSGVSIFCTNEDIKHELHKKLSRMRREREPSDSYLSVVVGKPKQKYSSFNGFIKKESSPTSNEKKAILLVTSCSKKERRSGIGKKVTIDHRILTYGDKACLVQVDTNTNSWHCVRVYLSTMTLSPVLGDNIYSSRVKELFGKKILIDKYSPLAELPQTLTEDMKKMLKLPSSNDVQVPVHLHLSEVKINLYDRAGTCHKFNAPIPESFSWTLKSLGLT